MDYSESPQKTENQYNQNIRWRITKDMPEVLAIEVASFESPWSKDKFKRYLRQKNCIGMVAESDDKINGYMFYELSKTRIKVSNFAVISESRRKKIGTQMVDKLIRTLSKERRTKILLEVSETNLAAQLFFKANKFRAIDVLRQFYDSEDAYLMQYEFQSDEQDHYTPVNRISSFRI